MCCTVLLSVTGVSLQLYVSRYWGGGCWLPWLPLPMRQTDSYYVLYTFLLNVLKKGCWGGGGGGGGILFIYTYSYTTHPPPPPPQTTAIFRDFKKSTAMCKVHTVMQVSGTLKLCFVGILKANDGKSKILSRIQIRIRTKMSRIHNTGLKSCFFFVILTTKHYFSIRTLLK